MATGKLANKATVTAGYSGTPLPQKLGLKEGGTLVLVNAPAGMEKVLQPIPDGAGISGTLRKNSSLVMLFCSDTAALASSLKTTASLLAPDGSLWIAWPKKTSRLFRDLTEDGIRAVVLPTGLVDVKVCAVNADWSGLKLMVRKELRDRWPKK